MAGSSQEVNQKACEIDKLGQILKTMMLEAVREMKAAFKVERKRKALAGNALGAKVFVSIQRPEEAEFSASTNQKKKAGRKLKNEVVAEKVVCFSLPENIDVQNIEDIDKVKERLGKWRIQRRKRDSKMSDAYYCHLSSEQTFRSIPEAVSFMMCEIDTKSTRNKEKGGNETSDSEPRFVKKARNDEENKVDDFSYETVEKWLYPTGDKSDYGLEYPNMSENGDCSPDDAVNYVQGKSVEQFPPPCYGSDLLNHFSDANQYENGKGLA